MPSIPIHVQSDDDPGFIEGARRLLAHELSYLTDEVYLVKVDQWFGRKWLKFSAKMLGALGVALKATTIAPFHPHRIKLQRHFELDRTANEYIRSSSAPLHIRQTSAANLKREICGIADSGTFVWYSGDTLKNGRGCMMVYKIVGAEHSEWYAELIREHDLWRTAQPVFARLPKPFTRPR
jgi:hypothetical protein